MRALIHALVPQSPAAHLDPTLGLLPGALITAIDGCDTLEDQFDYQLAIADSEELLLEGLQPDGVTPLSVCLEKNADEDPGLIFQSPIFGPLKTCNNACPFCFIDQQPEGLRSNLYVKDDDWRLSYFANTYITLTNLTERDRQRIAMIRPGPLYVSVHSTVPAIRERLLANPKHAGRIMTELAWLASLEIPFHCQVVICPGINDGEPLTQTLTDLATLRPHAQSVAVIPVGLTQHRGDLPELTAVTTDVAADVIARVEAFQACIPEGDSFVFLSDEFYFKANQPLPQYGAYGEFPQLDNGVGSARHLLDDFFQQAPLFPARYPNTSASNKTLFALATGKLGAMTLDPIARRLNEIEGLYVDVVTIESAFWGQAIDVAGLITGQDLLSSLQAQLADWSTYTAILIPGVMLKQDTTLFLDGMTLEHVANTLGVPFRVIHNATNARDLLVGVGLRPGVCHAILPNPSDSHVVR